MNKVMAAAAFCAALLICSGTVFAAAEESAAESAEIEISESSESYYDPIVLASGSLSDADSDSISDDSAGDASSHWASNVDSAGNVTYVDWELLSDGTLRISGKGSMPYLSAYDPAPWADNMDQIKKVIIEDGIQSVSSYAFQNCTTVTEAIIGEDVASIGEHAFDGCSNLKTIQIGKNVRKIFTDAFKGTAWLDEKREEDPLVTVYSILLDATTATGDVTIPDTVTTIQTGAFKDAAELTSVVIPEGVAEIPSDAFSGCSGLKSVKFPAGLYTIDYHAFAGCTSLTEIELPSGEIPASYTRSVRMEAFSGCTALSSVTIPDSWRSIDSSAFADTPWLESLRKETPLVVVNNNIMNAQDCKGDVVIPEGVTSIPSTIFAGNTEITSISLPKSLSNARTPNVFNGCTGLTKIIINNPLLDLTAILTNYGGPSFSGTIVGYDGSAAAKYAESKELAFESLGLCIGNNSNVTQGTARVALAFRPGEADTITSQDDVFAVGASIAEAEIVLENADELPFTVTDYSTVILNGYPYGSNGATFSKAYVNVSFEIPTDVEKGSYYVKFLVKKLTDFDGNDLLQYADDDAKLVTAQIHVMGDPVHGTGLLTPVEYDGVFRPVLDTFIKNTSENWKNYKGTPSSGVVNSEDLTSVSKLWLDPGVGEAWYCIYGDYLYVGAGDGDFFDAYSCVDGKILHVCSADENVTYKRYENALLEIVMEGNEKVYPYYDTFFNASKLSAYTASFYKLQDGEAVPDISFMHKDEMDPDKAYYLSNTPEKGSKFAYTPVTHNDFKNSGLSYRYMSSEIGLNTYYLSQLTGDVNPTEPTQPTEPDDQFDPTKIEGLGNVNDDTVVNASDAAIMLIEAATIGAGKETTFTQEQTVRADVNGDKIVNASDAALTLQYAAHIGAGGEGTFGEYLNSKKTSD